MPRSDPVALHISGGHPLIELRVFDDMLAERAHGWGWLDLELPPGIYTVRFTAADRVEEEHVELHRGQLEARVARRRSTWDLLRVPRIAGIGDQLRAATIGPTRSSARLTVCVHGGWKGARLPLVTLLTQGGEPLAVVGEAGVRGGRGHGLWWLMQVAVRPGAYRLRVTNPGEPWEQALVACRGYRTEALLLTGASRREGLARLAPGSVSIAMPPRDLARLSPWHSWLRLLRHGLAAGHVVASDETLAATVAHASEDAMMGIVGAHVIAAAQSVRAEAVRTYVTDLRRQLGYHPDVEALALLLGRATRRPFEAPPMLRSSWSAVCQASASRPELTPPASLASAIGVPLAAVGGWLRWQPTTVPIQPGELGRHLSDLAARAGLGESLARYAAELGACEAGPALSDRTWADVVRQLQVPRAAAAALLDYTARPEPELSSPW